MDLLSQIPAFEDPAAPEAEAGRAARERGPLRPPALASSRRRLRGEGMARRLRQVDTLTAFAAVAAGERLWSAAGWDAPLREVVAKAAMAVLALLLLRGAGAYTFRTSGRLSTHLAVVIGCCGTAVLMSLGVEWCVQGQAMSLLVWSLWTALALTTAHTVEFCLVALWRRSGRLTPTIVVVGATAGAERLIQTALGLRDTAVLGVFDDRMSRIPNDVHGVPVLGDTHALLTHRLLPYIDHIVITVTPSAQHRIRELIDRLKYLPNTVTLFMDLEGFDGQRRTLRKIADAPLAPVSGLQDRTKYRTSKRLQDLILGTAALLLAAPLMILIALAIRVESKGTIFFRQIRHGFNNEQINVWKFRSLRQNAEDRDASVQIQPQDHRVTRVGRVIRSLSLDELPQLLNVLKGEMSLVGPRPHAVGMRTAGAESARLVAEYAWRHRIKPGMTGWAQINGSIGPVDTPDLVRRRVALDIDYIERRSLRLDLYILLLTFPALLRARRGVR